MVESKQNENWSERFSEIENRLHILEREYQSQRQELRTAYQDIQVLAGLQELALALASTLDPEPLLRRIVSAPMYLLQAQGSSLLLLLEEQQELVFQVVHGEVSQQLVGRRLHVGQGIAGWVAQTGETAVVNDVQNDPRFAPSFDSSTGFRTESLICTPLKFQERTLGVLSIVNKGRPGGFEEKDVKWLKTLAALAAVAIENVRLYHRLREERDRVLVAQEELRKKLARDLHDGPTQTLSHIIMQADFIKKLMQHEPESVPTELDRLVEVGQQAIQEMRMMLFDLRPLVLETQGLVAALTLFAERHRSEGGPQIHVQADNSVARYEPRLESTVFSIVQEAVNNALKHAQADNIWVQLSEKGGMLTVEVEDDGVGFNMEGILHSYEERASFGLVNMHERAEIIDGQLTFISAIDQGTTVMLRVPAEQAPQEEEWPKWLPKEEQAEEPAS